MMRFLTQLRSRSGQMYVEALIPIVVIFALLYLGAFIFSMHSNALRSANAQTRTASYLSATGTWTEQQRMDCLRLLPGYDAELGTEQTDVSCEAYYQDDSGTWQKMPENLCGAATTPVADCFNQPSNLTGQQFVDYNKPLRLEITYIQPMPNMCAFGACADGDAQNEIKRSVQFYSQTRRIS